MILEGKEYEVKSKTTCDCGYQFTLQDMEELKRLILRIIKENKRINDKWKIAKIISH